MLHKMHVIDDSLRVGQYSLNNGVRGNLPIPEGLVYPSAPLYAYVIGCGITSGGEHGCVQWSTDAAKTWLRRNRPGDTENATTPVP